MYEFVYETLAVIEHLLAWLCVFTCIIPFVLWTAFTALFGQPSGGKKKKKKKRK